MYSRPIQFSEAFCKCMLIVNVNTTTFLRRKDLHRVVETIWAIESFGILIRFVGNHHQIFRLYYQKDGGHLEGLEVFGLQPQCNVNEAFMPHTKLS